MREFFEADIRKKRERFPVIEERVLAKYQDFFPNKVVVGKNVLDIGSCYGALGQWVLSNGASLYTGVEVDETFASKSRELLAPWDYKAFVIEKDVRTFLGGNPCIYDVVACLGVIYAFTDPVRILEQIVAITGSTLVLEGMFPRDQKLWFSKNVEYTEFSMVSKNGMKNGFAGLMGPMLADVVLEGHGFRRTFSYFITSDSEPTRDLSVAGRKGLDDPVRWVARYERVSKKRSYRTLESVVLDPFAEGNPIRV